MFHVGQKVVCVWATWNPRIHKETAPEKDKVYTVREVTSYNNVAGIRLVEIVNPHYKYDEGFNECAFDAKGFRPLEEKKEYKAMEIFRKIAADPKIKITEDA